MIRMPVVFAVAVFTLSLAACGGSGSTGQAADPVPAPVSGLPPSTGPTTSTDATSPSNPLGSSSQPVVADVEIADFKFAVGRSVAAGSTVTISNADREAHTVTSKQGGFNVKVDPHGTTLLTAPTTAGSYPFVCTIHADMAGTLVVT